eukprot:scaffold190865_cov28-Tisochrysis_lutea.AAC.3
MSSQCLWLLAWSPPRYASHGRSRCHTCETSTGTVGACKTQTRLTLRSGQAEDAKGLRRIKPSTWTAPHLSPALLVRNGQDVLRSSATGHRRVPKGTS